MFCLYLFPSLSPAYNTGPAELAVVPLYVRVHTPLLPGFFSSSSALHCVSICLSVSLYSRLWQYYIIWTILMYCYLKCCFSIQNSYSSGKELKIKIAQKIKALAAIPDKVSSTHMVEKKNWLLQVYFRPKFTHVHIYTKNKNNLQKMCSKKNINPRKFQKKKKNHSAQKSSMHGERW